MSTSNIVLNVDVRERTGRGGAREVRTQGRIPGVLYGGDKAPVSISLDKKTVKAALKSGKFLSHTVTLEYKGERQLVFAQDIQFHPVSDEPTHLDLYRVEPGQIIRVAVPVHVTGQGVSPGIKRGGAMNIVRHEIWLYAPADAIPAHLEADVSNLEIGDALKISAITLPEGVRPTIEGRDFTIITIALHDHHHRGPQGQGRCGRRQAGCRRRSCSRRRRWRQGCCSGRCRQGRPGRQGRSGRRAEEEVRT